MESVLRKLSSNNLELKRNCTVSYILQHYFVAYLVPSHCRPNPCQNDGVCKSLHDGYDCICVIRFTGPNCQSKYRSNTICTQVNGTWRSNDVVSTLKRRRNNVALTLCVSWVEISFFSMRSLFDINFIRIIISENVEEEIYLFKRN